MTYTQKLRLDFYLLCWTLSEELQKLKRQIWNKRILLAWHKLWLRKNEYHISLNLDHEALLEMSADEEAKYRNETLRRRHIAHEKGD